MDKIKFFGAAAPFFVSVAAFAGAGEAFAQSAATPGQALTTAPAAASVEEVIVTAQRRSERLERTPVAVSVLSAEKLAQQNIVTERDLQNATPGLTVRATGNSNEQNFAIRGQSLDAFSGSRPGVLPYIDEVQIGGFGSASSFYDLQNVQVLKGPQGTLFGRNSTGGAVLFTTAKPTYNFNGYASAQGGNYGFNNLEGAVTLPLIDHRLSLRVAGFHTYREGFQYNLYRDDHEGGVDRFGGRVSLLADITDKLQNVLVLDYSKTRGGSTAGVLYGLSPNSATPLASSVLYSPALDVAFNFPGAFAAYLGAHPKADPGGIQAVLSEQKARGPFVTDLDGENYIRGENVIISNVTSYQLTPNTTIKNIFGYTKLDNELGVDQDGTPYDIYESVGRNEGGYAFNQNQLSEELQVGGKALANDLNYVAGAYYAHEKQFNRSSSNVLDLAPLSPPARQVDTSNLYNETAAVYGQGSYDLSKVTGVNGLGVTAGLRYTHERNELNILPGDSAYGLQAQNPILYKNDQANTVQNVGYTVGLQEQLTRTLLLYITSRRSYRAGSFNNSQPPEVGSGATGGDSFDSETVTDLEGGVKFAGRLRDLPTRANLAIYNTWIDDDQRVAYVISNGIPSGITVNVPGSKVSGVEFDGQINPLSWLTFGVAGTYTDARFTDNSVVVLQPPAVRFTTYPDTPKWTGSFTADVAYPLTDRLRLDVHGDIYAQTGTYFTPLGLIIPNARLPGYFVTNFRVGIEDTRSGWSLAGVIKNAFDRTYYVGGFGLAPVLQLNTAIPGDPRTYLAELKYKF